jgi:hypothetical protein
MKKVLWFKDFFIFLLGNVMEYFKIVMKKIEDIFWRKNR